MNWTVITTSACKAEYGKLLDFFDKKGTKPSVLFIDDETDEYEKKIYKSISDMTHCIFIADKSFTDNKHLFFLTGYLLGAGIPAFIVGKTNLVKNKKLLKNFAYFKTIDDLIKAIDEQFPVYIAEEEKQSAHKKLFEKGIPFTPDCFSSYIAQDNIEICELFYEAGMDVNVRDAAGTPMLCIAARCDKERMIEWLIEKGADIDGVSKDRGYSAVMDAVWKSSTDIVELLIKLGANLNFVSNDGQTALIVATGATNDRICELLVKNGADPDVKDRMGMSSLDYARLFKKERLIPLYEEYAK